MSDPITTVWLKIFLLSDTTFGRGDGVAGLVDAEIQHDDLGLPYLGGKTLKGLLGGQSAEILFALQQSHSPGIEDWQSAATFLFGQPGSKQQASARMQVSDAQLPKDLRLYLQEDYRLMSEEKRSKARLDNLNALTALRHQTAMDETTGAPKKHSLRTMRVILRQTPFIARLDFKEDLTGYPQLLLAAIVKSFRRAGTGRSRGRGRIEADLFIAPFYNTQTQIASDPEPVTRDWFKQFSLEVSQ